MNNLRVGTGNTKVGTKLDFNVMANPFGIKKMTEKQAIELIKSNGFGIKRVKLCRKVVSIQPTGNEDKIYDFIETLIENRVYVDNGAIAIK